MTLYNNMPITSINLSNKNIDFFKSNSSLSKSKFIRECIETHPQYKEWEEKSDRCGYGK